MLLFSVYFIGHIVLHSESSEVSKDATRPMTFQRNSAEPEAFKCTWKANGKYSCNEEKTFMRWKTKKPKIDEKDEGEHPIKLLTDCGPRVQDSVIEHLHTHWWDSYAKKGKTEADLRQDFLETTKSGENVLAVLTPDNEDDWIGCVALSISTPLPTIVAPCISHLYVKPAHRSKGYGKKLVAWAEARVTSSGRNLVALWCEPHLEGYYLGLGYKRFATTQTEDTASVLIMAKNVNLKPSACDKNASDHLYSCFSRS